MRYITVEDLSFYYDKEPVLEHINYSVDSGEFVTLTGENGAAKTTLIKASLGILQPRIGNVTISKTNTQGKKLRIAYLPQQIASFNAGFPSTVYEFVKSGRYPRKGWFRRLNAHDEEHIKASLDSVGMWEHRDKRLGSLSGGQKQRAVIARMFASDPDVFILDEPTTGTVSYTHLEHTYGDLKADSDSLAAAIDQLDLPEKSPVVVFGGQEYEMLATFVALTKSCLLYTSS